MCVLRILVEKQNKTTLFKVTEPCSVPYRTPSAYAKRAAYPDPPPVIPVTDTVAAQVCFITAGPITELFVCGGKESGGHVL